MHLVILKTNGGMDFPTPSGKISLQGFCILNHVSDNQISELKKFDSFNEMVKNGYIEIANQANHKDANTIAAEVIKEQAKKQNSRTKNIQKEG